jgi:hypothetical protein
MATKKTKVEIPRGRMPQSEDDIGYTAREILTGFQGLISYRVAYLTGCNQYGLLTPAPVKEGEKSERQFDENRLEIIESIPKVVLNKPEEKKIEPLKGGPQPFVGK